MVLFRSLLSLFWIVIFRVSFKKTLKKEEKEDAFILLRLKTRHFQLDAQKRSREREILFVFFFFFFFLRRDLRWWEKFFGRDINK